jgi:mannose-6-phosphate isomerase-like protein (cupin superfamily)
MATACSDRDSVEGEEMSIQVVGPADGESTGAGPIQVRIIEDGSHTEHRLGLIEAVVPPGPAGPPQHVHRDHDETFIVTEGKLRFTSGDDSVDVETGSCVTVPAGTPHTFSNPFGEAGKVICTLTPDLYVEYFRDLGKLPLNEQGMPDPGDIVRTMAKYGTVVTR